MVAAGENGPGGTAGSGGPADTSGGSRPYVLLSVAVSVDGYIDDTADERLLLSNEADFDRVDELRAWSDAILVGAETVRRDNPRLIVKDEGRRRARVAAGKPEYPRKVTVTAAGDLDPGARFWHHGTAEHPPLVYTTESGARRVAERLTVPGGERPTAHAEIVALGPELDFGALLDDLAARGIARLMVEGGGRIHTAFLAGGLADELHLAIGPTLVGDSQAPRFLYPAEFPGGSAHRMSLLGVAQLGDVAVLRYRPQEARCPNPTTTIG
ncbi:RibD family protein [Nocardia carnea]|uniref:RibD family protein n=1 Tax=Nocardia carnea TaxID=37328 RepID=A0ABW7TRP5_9NOCA|nr:dihydrofolate reductase family protein [Nocardia carnea]